MRCWCVARGGGFAAAEERGYDDEVLGRGEGRRGSRVEEGEGCGEFAAIAGWEKNCRIGRSSEGEAGQFRGERLWLRGGFG